MQVEHAPFYKLPTTTSILPPSQELSWQKKRALSLRKSVLILQLDSQMEIVPAILNRF